MTDCGIGNGAIRVTRKPAWAKSSFHSSSVRSRPPGISIIATSKNFFGSGPISSPCFPLQDGRLPVQRQMIRTAQSHFQQNRFGCPNDRLDTIVAMFKFATIKAFGKTVYVPLNFKLADIQGASYNHTTCHLLSE